MTVSTHADSSYTSRAWLLWFFAALFYAYQFILRVSPGVMSDELMQFYAIDATQLGLLTSFYYYAYVGMQLPLGIMIDRIGSERLLSYAALLLGAASALFALAPNLAIASLARFLIGVCSACGWIGCVVLATRWFPPQQKSLVISLTMGLGTLGAMAGGLPLELFINFVGWQKALLYLSLGGLFVGASLFLVVRSMPNCPSKRLDQSGTPPPVSTWTGLRTVIQHPQCWFVPLYAMLMWLPIAVFGDLWGISLLERTYKLKEGMAATFVACLFMGVTLGGPIFTLIARRLSSYRTPLYIGATFCLGIYSTIIFVPNIPLPMLYFLFLLAGINFTAQLLCFSIVTDSTPPNLNGTAMAFTNMIVMSSGVIGLPAIGWLLDWSAGATVSIGMEGYSATDFKVAFSFIPLSLIIAIFLVFKIKDTYPQNH